MTHETSTHELSIGTDTPVSAATNEPVSGEVGTEWHARRAALLASAVVLAYTACGIARYRTYTNGTFDLAFYSRMAWGMARANLWDPILSAHVFGLHLSPILVPIGWLGALIGTPIALYVAQGLAASLASYPLARIGARHLGPFGAYAGALALALHPNLGHVLAYEAHPGTLALFPIATLVDAVDRRSARGLVLSTLGVLMCREDLALITAFAAVALALHERGPRGDARLRAAAFASLSLSLVWLGTFLFVLHPLYRPAHGSLEAHFGGFGSTPAQIARTLLTQPGRVLAHLAAPKRLTYLPRILAPLALLPLLSPRALFVASPVLGVALLSFFVTTTRIDSHYLTPALPMLVWGALDGARLLRAKFPRVGRGMAPMLIGTSLLGTLGAGLFSPFRSAPTFMHPAIDPASLDRLVAMIPRDASVEAPDAILPHVAERRFLMRSTTYVGDADAVVLDTSHRSRFAHREDLLRTTEEPRIRSYLSRVDRRLVAVAGPYLLLLRERGRDEATAARRVDPIRIDPHRLDDRRPREPLCACLALADASITNGVLALDFVVTGACPNDLAIRLGSSPNAARVDLLFGGLVSPVHLQVGDTVRSFHVPPGGDELYVGALRSSGARPDPSDPVSVRVPLRR